MYMVVGLSDEGRRGTYGEGGEETKLGLNNVQQRRIMADDLKKRYGKAIIQQRSPPGRMLAIVTRLSVEQEKGWPGNTEAYGLPSETYLRGVT
jgi:hypothetical protein